MSHGTRRCQKATDSHLPFNVFLMADEKQVTCLLHPEPGGNLSTTSLRRGPKADLSTPPSLLTVLTSARGPRLLSQQIMQYRQTLTELLHHWMRCIKGAVLCSGLQHR